jgi:hypothetical protein
MKKVKTLLLGLVVASLLQGQTSTWRLGSGGAVEFAKIGNPANWKSSTNTSSGSATPYNAASVNDANGNLIFYTDGRDLFTKSANLPTSKKTSPSNQLLGSPTATQSALIIPLQDNGSTCTHYLVFTTVNLDTDPASTDGLSINLVNVIGSNPYAIAPYNMATSSITLFGKYFTEKLCATQDGAGGYWIAAHGYDADTYQGYGGDVFYMFHIAPDFFAITSGDVFQMQSVLTTNLTGSTNILASSGYLPLVIGATHAYSGGGPHLGAKGQMKFNRLGTKLAIAMPDRVEVYSFDKTTGILDSPINPTTFQPQVFNFSNSQGGNSPYYAFHTQQSYSYPYGIEFAPNLQSNPNIQYLYVSESYFDPYEPNHIYQCNLSNPAVVPVIVKSATAVGASPYVFGSMQLGLDNKIYVVRSGSEGLGVIAYPDALHDPYATINASGSACGYINNGFPLFTFPTFLNTGIVNLNLPSIITGIPSCSGSLQGYTATVCANCPGD